MQNEQKTYPQGMKWTRQRKDVYDVLAAAPEPLSAIQIYNQIGEDYAFSTIYRILTAFEESNLVTKSNWMDSNTLVYALNRGEHTHYAVCLTCHKHIQLHACPLEHMHFPKAEGEFQVVGHKLELYGYCKDCSKEI